jgi:hypothetical protein
VKRALLWDSSAIPALLDADDAGHDAAFRFDRHFLQFAGCRVLGISP